MRAIPSAIAVVAFVLASTVSRASDIGFQRSLTMPVGNVSLNVCTGAGMIHVHGASGGVIEISAKIHRVNWHSFGNEAEMKQIAANPPIQQNGGTVRVGNDDTCGGRTYHNIDIDYEISVPNSSGVTAESGSGNIHLENIGGTVNARTGSGDVVVNGTGQQTTLKTGSGTIDIQDARGTLLALTGSGNIAVRDSQLTEARLQSMSGSVTVTKLHGGLRARSGSGSLTIAGFPSSPWSLETSSGNIHFEAAAHAGFDLDAESGSGKVTSTLPGTVADHAGDVVKISVNGGGPEVRMYTSTGNIDLK